MFDWAIETIFFFLFAGIALLFSLLAVLCKKLIHAALYLMIVLSTSCAFYILLASEFFAGIQLLLYVGGVLILVVFAIMVTTTYELDQIPASRMRKFFSAIAAIGFFLTCISIFTEDYFQIYAQVSMLDEISAIGISFLSIENGGYIISFELISFVILVALIGGIVIGRKDDNYRSKQKDLNE